MSDPSRAVFTEDKKLEILARLIAARKEGRFADVFEHVDWNVGMGALRIRRVLWADWEPFSWATAADMVGVAPEASERSLPPLGAKTLIRRKPPAHAENLHSQSQRRNDYVRESGKDVIYASRRSA